MKNFGICRGTMTVLLVAAYMVASAAVEKPMVVINDDCTYFLEWLNDKYRGQRVTREMLEEYAGRFHRGPVTHHSINTQSMIGYFKSRTLGWVVDYHDRLRGRCGLNAGPDHDRKMKMLRQIDDDGMDPFAIFMETAKKHGITPWVSMRMNDIHNVTVNTNCYWAPLWAEHPEYRIDPTEPSGPANRNYGRGLPFDFRHEAVRRHHLDAFDELIRRYTVCEAVEMDFMRHPWYFRRGHEREDAHFLTDFMRQAKKLVEAESVRRGRRLEIAVRIPSRPSSARGIGIDFDVWAREGLFDILIAANDIMSTDFELSVPGWREELAKVGCRAKVIVSTDVYCSPECDWWGRRSLKIEEQHGWIERHLADHVDGFYYFNMIYGMPTSPGYPFMLNENWTYEDFAAKKRFYPVGVSDVPAHELRGYQFGPVGEKPRELKIRCGLKPTRGKLSALLTFSEEPRQSTLDSIRLNGVAPTTTEKADPNEATHKERQGNFAARAHFPLSAMKDRDNVVTILGDGKVNGKVHSCRIEVDPGR